MEIKCSICENFTIEIDSEGNYQCKTCGVVFDAEEINKLQKEGLSFQHKIEPYDKKKPNITKKTVVSIVSTALTLTIVLIILLVVLKKDAVDVENKTSQSETVVSEEVLNTEKNYSKTMFVNGADYGGAFEKELTIYNVTDEIIVFDLFYYRLWGAERVVANIKSDGKAYFKTEEGVEGNIQLLDQKAIVSITKSNDTDAEEETIEYSKIERLNDMIEGIVDISDSRGTPFGIDFSCTPELGLVSEWDSDNFLMFSDMKSIETGDESEFNFVINAPYTSDKSAADIVKANQLLSEDGSSISLENIVEMPVQLENEKIAYYRECKTSDNIYLIVFTSKIDDKVYSGYFVFANTEVYNKYINTARAMINSLKY